MASQAFFSIRHLGLPQNYKVDTPIFSITNHEPTKKALLDPSFLKILGVKTEQNLRQNTLGFALIEGDEKNPMQRAAMRKKLVSKSKMMQTFLLFLWFVKDNSISLEETYGNFPGMRMWTHWNGNLINSTSEGDFKETMYEEAELTTAVSLVLKYAAICPQRPEEGNDHDYSDATTVSQLNPGYPREIVENKLERAIASIFLF